MFPRQSRSDSDKNASGSAPRRITLDFRSLTSLGCLSLMGEGAVLAQVEAIDPLQLPPVPPMSESVYETYSYGSSYAAPAPVYETYVPSYAAPVPAYGAYDSGYTAPAPAYEAYDSGCASSGPAYESYAPSYVAPYAAPAPAYSTYDSGYAAEPVYETYNSGYAAPAPAYGGYYDSGYAAESGYASGPDLSGVPAEVIFNSPAPLPSVLDDFSTLRESAPAHSYIDNTDYSIGATQPTYGNDAYYDREATIVLEERSTGCASSISPGQALANGVCAGAVFEASAPGYGYGNGTWTADAAPTQYESGGYYGGAETYASPAHRGNGASYETASYYGGGTYRSAPAAAAPAYPSAYPAFLPAASAPMAAAPINLSDRSSSFDPYAATGLSYEYIEAQMTRNLAVMPLGRIGNGNTNLLFPVSMPSPISSFFGFRTHPIAGVQRLHTGTDIAAPYGIPVLAAFSGEVVESSSFGGYGLTVILSHNDGNSETLYAHMSELLVNVGDDVEQGDPIGRVGSTGFSTGPHLHFEVKQMSDMGWVYLDANRQLEIALERLIDTSQLAQLPGGSRDSF